MNDREYAEYAGMSRTAVRNAIAADKLVLHADGSIDAAASDVRRAQAVNPARQHGRNATPLRPVPEAAVGAVAETLREQGLSAPQEGGNMTFLQARTANEVLKAQERKMRVQKMKGELVDRARAEALVFRLARQERDAWVGWPARVAAVMASELMVSPSVMLAVLESHVRQHLSELAEVQLDLE